MTQKICVKLFLKIIPSRRSKTLKIRPPRILKRQKLNLQKISLDSAPGDIFVGMPGVTSYDGKRKTVAMDKKHCNTCCAIMEAGGTMDINTLLTYLLTPAAQIALIMALAELVKRIGLDSRFIPLVDLGLGILSGVMVYTVYLGMQVTEGVLVGIAIGLSACGLFSGVKNVAEKIKEGDEDGKEKN